jgi:hypothetical protein
MWRSCGERTIWRSLNESYISLTESCSTLIIDKSMSTKRALHDRWWFNALAGAVVGIIVTVLLGLALNGVGSVFVKAPIVGNMFAQLCKTVNAECRNAVHSSNSDVATLRTSILGKWRGLANTPWTEPYPVLFQFMNDEQYSARSLEDRNVALYYGTDEDSPQKVYRITSMNYDGEGLGEIEVYFGPNNSRRARLDHLNLSQNNNLLTFEFWYGDYGPIRYDLRRLREATQE